MSSRDAAVDADPNARALERRVALAHAAGLTRRAVEALAIGFSAAALALAAEALAHTGGGASRAWTVAAAAAALAWWVEHAPGRAETIERVDRRAELDGALTTFVGLSGPAAPRARAPWFRRELARRLAARLSAARALRAVSPSHPGILAVPCACAALWLWARDQPARVGERAPGGSTSLASVRERAGRQDGAPTSPAAAEARALLNEWRRAADAAVADGAHADASAELAQRARALRDDPTVAEDVRRALAELLDAPALDARAPDRPGASTEALGAAPDSSRAGAAEGSGGSSSTDAGGAAPGAGVAAPTSRSGSESGAAGLARAGESSAPGATNPEASASVAAQVAGTWWEPRYDAVVERWIEARRRQR